jgi:hypothetical protein
MPFTLVFPPQWGCGVWAALVGWYIPREVVAVVVVAVILIQQLLEIGQMLCGGRIL